jgi:hypothetical protein
MECMNPLSAAYPNFLTCNSIHGTTTSVFETVNRSENNYFLISTESFL